MMKINEQALKIIKDSEGLRLDAYLCPSSIPTIGYGSTGSHVRLGMSITKEEAEELLRQDVERFEKAVATELSHISLNTNQFSALVSLCFNCGLAPIKEGNTIRKHLESRDYSAAASAFLLWVKDSTGNSLPGLVIRRQKEKDLFMKNPVLDRYLLIFKEDSFIKMDKRQASELDEGEKISVKAGNYYLVHRINDSYFLGHYCLALDSDPSTPVYVYKGHVNLYQLSEIGPS